MKLRSSIPRTFRATDYDIRKIDLAFIKDFEFYLWTERKCGNNSAVKYVRNFGKIIRLCLENHWLLINPFMGYKGKIKNVRRCFLSEEEIERMASKEFTTERLSQCVMYFYSPAIQAYLISTPKS